MFANVKNAFLVLEHGILLLQYFGKNTGPEVVEATNRVLGPVREQIFFGGVAMKIKEKIYFFSLCLQSIDEVHKPIDFWV